MVDNPMDADPDELARLRDELRRSQAALRRSHEQLAEVGRRAASLERELTSATGRLEESWEQIRLMRNSISWRLTAPIRAIQGLRR